MIINVRMSSCKIPADLSDLNETVSDSTESRKILKYKISWKSLYREPRCSLRTDRYDETNYRFSQFWELTWRPVQVLPQSLHVQIRRRYTLYVQLIAQKYVHYKCTKLKKCRHRNNWGNWNFMCHTEPKPPKYPHAVHVAPPLIIETIASRAKVLYFCFHVHAPTYGLLQLLLFVSVNHTLMMSPQLRCRDSMA